MHGQSVIFLIVLIPLVVWSFRRRGRRMAQAADRWFKPVGGGYIYQPYGRFGKAYVISPAVREQIRQKHATLIRLPFLALIVVYAAPVVLLSVNPQLYLEYRPWIMPIRIGIVLAFVPLMLLWSSWVIRPLYANAPVSQDRITMTEVRAKTAREMSWALLLVSLFLTALLTAGSVYTAQRQDNPLFYLGAVLFGAGFLLYLRYAYLKLESS